MKKILLSTGGSGGHVIPALTLYDHLKNNFNISIVTDQRGSKFIDKNVYNYNLVRIPKISKNIFIFFIDLIKIIISIIKCIIFLKKNNIDILVSTGGYMSFPFSVGSKILGVKLILFEPNRVIGRSNKLMARYADSIICYSKYIKNFPSRYTNKIILVDAILPKKIYKFEKKLKNLQTQINLLILGGSQGAKFFDNFAKNLILNLSNELNIKVFQQVHDENNIYELENFYNQNNIENNLFSFDVDIIEKMAECNFAITRCGASTLAELSYLNIPFVGIPYPYAKDNHQYYNVIHYEQNNCCWVYLQEVVNIDEILKLFKEMINDNTIYEKKYQNLKKISYKNNWNNLNKKLIEIFNEY